MSILPYTRRDWFWHWAKAFGALMLVILGFAGLCALIWAVLSRV